jgi:hypothetical protein
VWKHKGKRKVGNPRCRWVKNVIMDGEKISWDDVDWIDMA